MPRFVVQELEGWAIGKYGGKSWRSGLSCTVIDTGLMTKPIVATFRTEDVRTYHMTPNGRREAVRNRAAGLAAMLEAECADD
jgi:hypothetical protein